MKEKFSKFVHFFKKDRVIAIYNVMNHGVLFVGEEELQQIEKSLSSDKYDEQTLSLQESMAILRGKGIIVPEDDQEDKKLIELQKSILSVPWINTMYLLITSKCNFGCTYCFFEGSYLDPYMDGVHMSTETAIRAIRKFTRHQKDAEKYSGFPIPRPNIIFYGGEPFMNPGVFMSAVYEIDALKKSGELPGNTMVSVNSNASLITDEIATFCSDHGIDLDVSLDGYESIHDASRLWHDRKNGTFASVMKGIDRLKKAGARISISCTVAEENIQELPDILRWFVDDLGIYSIGFNPLLDSHQYKIGNPEYNHRIASTMIECYKIAREKGAYEERMMRKVKAFVDGVIYDRDCCGCGQQIVVAPDGSVGVCHAYTGDKKYFVPPSESSNLYEHPFWKEWSRRSPINMPRCHNCEALTICGGGCPHNADIQKGSIWEIDEGFCIHAKETLKWLIWDLYEKSQN